jgi:isopentenyl diphosphate isomerase/L-lactate dehydrogenase-like FMN-dependent dehydrogenase
LRDELEASMQLAGITGIAELKSSPAGAEPLCTRGGVEPADG